MGELAYAVAAIDLMEVSGDEHDGAARHINMVYVDKTEENARPKVRASDELRIYPNCCQ